MTQVITNEFFRRFKFDNSINHDLAILLSKDKTEVDNDRSIMGVLNAEI